MRAAGNGRDLAQAQLLADSVMSEIVAGVIPPQPLDQVPHDMYPGWLVSTAFDTTVHQGILRVTVLVERDSASARRPQYQLSRCIRDPTIPPPVDPAAAASTSATGSTSSSTGSSTGGGSQP